MRLGELRRIAAIRPRYFKVYIYICPLPSNPVTCASILNFISTVCLSFCLSLFPTSSARHPSPILPCPPLFTSARTHLCLSFINCRYGVGLSLPCIFMLGSGKGGRRFCPQHFLRSTSPHTRPVSAKRSSPGECPCLARDNIIDSWWWWFWPFAANLGWLAYCPGGSRGH
jgi:hypothetical protein